MEIIFKMQEKRFLMLEINRGDSLQMKHMALNK